LPFLDILQCEHLPYHLPFSELSLIGSNRLTFFLHFRYGEYFCIACGGNRHGFFDLVTLGDPIRLGTTPYDGVVFVDERKKCKADHKGRQICGACSRKTRRSWNLAPRLENDELDAAPPSDDNTPTRKRKQRDIQPFEELTGETQKKKRIKDLKDHLPDALKGVIEEHLHTNNIILRELSFQVGEDRYNVVFHSEDDNPESGVCLEDMSPEKRDKVMMVRHLHSLVHFHFEVITLNIFVFFLFFSRLLEPWTRLGFLEMPTESWPVFN